MANHIICPFIPSIATYWLERAGKRGQRLRAKVRAVQCPGCRAREDIINSSEGKDSPGGSLSHRSTPLGKESLYIGGPNGTRRRAVSISNKTTIGVPKIIAGDSFFCPCDSKTIPEIFFNHVSRK